MRIRHGHTLITLTELGAALRYSKEHLKRWFLRSGVTIRKGQLVTLTDAAKVFGLSTPYLSALLDGRDRLLTGNETAAALNMSPVSVHQQPVGRVIDLPRADKRYSHAIVSAVATPVEEAV